MPYLRPCLQGLPRPLHGRRVSHGDRLRRRLMVAARRRRRRLRPQRVCLPHLTCVQSLQQPRMRAGMPHRRHAQRRAGFGVARRGQVHRLRILHHGLSLPRAAHRRTAQALQQMRRMPRPRGARRAAHLRGGVPVARSRLRRGLRAARAPPRCRALHHAAAGRKRDQPEPLHPALSRCARSRGRRIGL